MFTLAPAYADSWLTPIIQARASRNGQFVVRVVPGKSMGDVFGYGGSPKGEYATAEWYKFDGNSYRKIRTISLLNPIAPVDIEVTERGSLITIDNWHNLGFGYVVVIYRSSGEVVKKYTLHELYSNDDIARIETSISSIQWRCHGFSTILASATELVVDDSIGGRFIFNANTGTFRYEHNAGNCQ